jgi:hypothetical protein
MFTHATLGAIGLFQTDVCPRKGCRYVHSAVHGGADCSGAKGAAVAKSGLLCTPLRDGTCGIDACTCTINPCNQQGYFPRKRPPSRSKRYVTHPRRLSPDAPQIATVW